MTPEEKRSYLQFLKDMATQQANEGLQGMVDDAQAMEQEYARNRPDPAAMDAAKTSDTARGYMHALAASIRGREGNQGAAQVYGRAAAESPEQDALKNKQGAFMDYLKGLSGLKAQKNAVALPFLQKREADARDAVSDFDKTQATAEASKTAAEQKAKHDELWAAVESGKMDERQAQNQFNRWMAGQTLDLKREALAQQKELASSKLGAKQDAEERELMHPDPDYSPTKIKLTPPEARKAREAYASVDMLRQAIPELSALVDKAGRGIKLSPDELARASTLATDIQLRMKNEEVYGLGVLTGPDLSLLKKAVPEPGEINWGFMFQTGPTKLAQTLKNINTNYASKMKGAGFPLKSAGGDRTAKQKELDEINRQLGEQP